MSLLSKLTPDQVIEKPFPHIVVENILEPAFCEQLIKEFPKLNKFTKGKKYNDNHKIYLPAYRAINDSTLSDSWRKFTIEHCEDAIWKDALRLFRPYILKEYPDFEQRFALLDELETALRDKSTNSNIAKNQVLLDSKILIHTPIFNQTCVQRQPHLKILKTLFLSYLSLKPDEDKSEGAEHIFYSLKPGKELILGDHQVVDIELLNIEKVIPYKKNTFVIFMNTPNAIQGVAARSPSTIPYMAHHFTMHVKEALFTCKLKPGVMASEIENLMPWYKKYPRTIKRMINNMIR